MTKYRTLLLLLGIACAPARQAPLTPPGPSGNLTHASGDNFSVALPQDPEAAISVLEDNLESDLGRLGLSLPSLEEFTLSQSTAPSAPVREPVPSDTSSYTEEVQPAAAADAPTKSRGGLFRGGKRKARKAEREAEEERQETCRQVCEVVDSICDAAERICQIAERLPPESDGQARCERAEDACERAEKQGSSCGCQ